MYLRDYVVDIYHPAKFHPDRIGVLCLRMRDFTHQIVYSAIFSCFFGEGGVLHLIYTQDARTDFNAKYVKRRGPAQGCAFWGWQNQTLSFSPFFAPKNTILVPVFDGTWNFRSKTPLTLDMYKVCTK